MSASTDGRDLGVRGAFLFLEEAKPSTKGLSNIYVWKFSFLDKRADGQVG